MRSVILLIVTFLAANSYAESKVSATGSSKSQTAEINKTEINKEVDILRQLIRNGKTDVISKAMNISDAAQAAKFWSLYRQYESDLSKIGDKRVKLIEDYLKSYSNMNNETANDLIDRALDNQTAVIELRRKHADKMASEISPIVAARFLQVEGFIQRYIDLELDSRLPLMSEATGNLKLQG